MQGSVGELKPAARRRALLWVPAAAMAIAIFVLSSIPGHVFPDVHFRFADKLVHAVIYGMLAVFLAIPLQRVKAKSGWGWVIAIATLIAGLYGITDELHQRFTPFRSSDAWDVVADTVGALIGVIVYVGAMRARSE